VDKTTQEMLAAFDDLRRLWESSKKTKLTKAERGVLFGVLGGAVLLTYAEPLSKLINEATEAYREMVTEASPKSAQEAKPHDEAEPPLSSRKPRGRPRP
jgi:hypothetical protein